MKVVTFPIGTFNIRKINTSQQKRAVRIISSKDKFAHKKEIFKEQKILDIYQFNFLSNIATL